MSTEQEEQQPPRPTSSLIVADTVICVFALAAFVFLSAVDKERTALYATVLGTFTPILLVQLHLRNDIREGQKRAAKRSGAVVEKIEELAKGMPRTPEELTEFIDARIAVTGRQIVSQTVAEMRIHGWQMPEVVQRAQA